MASYIFWAQFVQIYIDPRHQGHGVFQDFIILLDLSYVPGENEVLFMKIGARALDLRPNTFPGLIWPKYSL